MEFIVKSAVGLDLNWTIWETCKAVDLVTRLGKIVWDKVNEAIFIPCKIVQLVSAGRGSRPVFPERAPSASLVGILIDALES